ncbi:MAG: hypothetical protein IPM47_10275 [Sphingobacteriales bacterium]|nr:MAG: hypothetical protein IPM47_10275 [Sphingobacteriales bacterium]
MNTQQHQQELLDKYLMEKLQSLLLQEDRRQLQDIKSSLSNLRIDVSQLNRELSNAQGGIFALSENMNNPERLKEKVTPIVNLRIQQLKKNFGLEFGKEVKETVKDELENSKDEFIEVLFPIIGKLIQRYVRYQFDIFLENTQKGIGKTFSLQWWKQFVNSVIKGESMTTRGVKAAMPAQIEEVFMIQSNSGLLIGYYSRNNTADPDLIAAMLTAIQNFVNEAFKQDSGGLQTIDYENQRIILHSFYKHYTATVVSGLSDTGTSEQLNLALSDFSSSHIPASIQEIDDSLFHSVSKRLKETFEEFDLS